MNLFLQNLMTEVRVTNVPGLKWRCFYLIGDLYAMAYFDSLPGISKQILDVYGLEWSAGGLQA